MPIVDAPCPVAPRRRTPFALGPLPTGDFVVPALDPSTSVRMRTRLERARRDVRRPTMTVADYERLLGLVDQLLDAVEIPDDPAHLTTAAREPSQLLAAAYQDLQANYPRLIARCLSDMHASWIGFYERSVSDSTADTVGVHDDGLTVFVVDGLDRHFPSPARGPIRHLLDDATVAHPDEAGDRRLVVTPGWLYRMLVTFWPRRPAGALAPSPLSPPLPQVGPATLCRLDDVEVLASLWSSDPRCVFFDPAAVVTAARLL